MHLLATQWTGAVLLQPRYDTCLMKEVVARQKRGSLPQREFFLAYSARFGVGISEVASLNQNHGKVPGKHQPFSVQRKGKPFTMTFSARTEHK